MKQTAQKFLGIMAYLGAEAGTVMAEPNINGIAKAVSYKTGLNFLDGSFDPQRFILGYGPTVMFEVGKRIPALAKQLTNFR